jgi:hypothetical protein
MSNYIVNHSDPGKSPIVITTGTADNSTSLTLIGRNYPNFGQPIAENFLQLLENFASPNLPNPPIDGQLWYNTSDVSSKKLKVYDGAKWVPTNGVWQGATDPIVANLGSKIGDIWVDTERQLLKIQTEAGWVLVGPTFSYSNRTGSYPDSIVDKNGDPHDVIFMYLNDIAIEIIAKETFTPLTIIDGFTNIVPGINVSSKVFDGTMTKIAGIAEAASSLRQTSPVVENVNANNFVRNDINQSINGILRINNNAGIQIGQTTSTFSLQRNARDAKIVNSFDNGKFTFTTFKAGVPTVLMTIDGSSKRIGVGTDGVNDNINPSATFDVLGTMKVSGAVNFISTDSSALTVAGGATVGGLVSSKPVTVNSTTFFKGVVTIGDNSQFLTQPSGLYSATTGTIDIGTTSKPFRTIYASEFVGGTFVGTVQGAATKLANTSRMTISGDMRTTNLIDFDGNGGVPVPFITELTTASILSKATAFTIEPADSLLIYSTTATSLAKVTKAEFVADLYKATVPTGCIMPNASDTLPAGWAWCDGHPYNQTGPGYVDLFGKIGIKYGYSAGPSIDFRVPNLNNTTSASYLSENTGPYSLYAGTTTNVTTWPIGIKYIIKL